MHKHNNLILDQCKLIILIINLHIFSFKLSHYVFQNKFIMKLYIYMFVYFHFHAYSIKGNYIYSIVRKHTIMLIFLYQPIYITMMSY